MLTRMTDTQPTVGGALERDHRVIDQHFAAFSGALDSVRVDAGSFRAGSERLRHHIWVEEELHFPPLRAAGLVGPVLVMLREHGEIWDLLDAIEEGLGAEPDVASLHERWTALEALIDNHNMKEERILYPAGDGQLEEETATAILAALSSGERPADWEPEMAGRG